MKADRFLFTSESVTEGHPDKVADQISDAILDAILEADPYARVAAETMVTTGLVLVTGEITTECYVDIPSLVRDTVRKIGYTRASTALTGYLRRPHCHRRAVPGHRPGGGYSPGG